MVGDGVGGREFQVARREIGRGFHGGKVLEAMQRCRGADAGFVRVRPNGGADPHQAKRGCGCRSKRLHAAAGC